MRRVRRRFVFVGTGWWLGTRTEGKGTPSVRRVRRSGLNYRGGGTRRAEGTRRGLRGREGVEETREED